MATQTGTSPFKIKGRRAMDFFIFFIIMALLVIAFVIEGEGE